jgi:hypothetical protein
MARKPTNDWRRSPLRAELGRISRRLRRGKPLKREPVHVPEQATQVKDLSGSTLAFH